MDPLSWSDHPAVGTDELTAELRALHRHLARWAAGQSDAEPLASLLAVLERGTLVGVERLRQTFFPAVDVLRLRLEVDGRQSVGVFLSQRMARGYPSLWPIADSSGNLYEFVEAIPGALDMTPANVVDYGLFFANEAVAGDEGRFRFHRDFASWPASVQQQARATVAAGLASTEPSLDDDDPGSGEFLRRLAAYLARPARDTGPAELERLLYDREHDQYRFSVFGEYAGQAYAAEIQVNRATGLPEMERDLALAPIETVAADRRLPAINLSPALKLLIEPDPRILPNEDLPPLDPAGAASALRQPGGLRDVRVTGDLVVDRTLDSLRIENCVIDGSLRAEGIAVAGDLTVERVSVGGNVELGGAKIGGRLSLLCLTVAGEIDLSDALVTLRAHCADLRARTVLARHLSVERGALLIGPAGGDPLATGIVALEHVNLSGASATSGIKITDSHLGGQLNLRDCRTSGTIELGAAAETRMFVRGRIDLSGIAAGADVLVRGVHVGADVVLAGGSIAGRLRFGSPPRPASRAGQDCTIAGDLVATNCEITGPLTLGGVQIQGTLRLELADLGSVISEGRIVVQPSPERLATIQPTIIRNGVEILACRIRGELRLSRAILDQRYAGLFSFEMTSATVGQGVSFWDEGAVEPRITESFVADLDRLARAPGVPDGATDLDWSQRVRWIIGPFQPAADPVGWPVTRQGEPLPSIGFPPEAMTDETEGDAGAEISVGELESHLSARHFFTAVRGDLRLALCRIGGDLSLDNLRADGHRILLESLTIDGDLLAEWKGRRYRAPAERSAEPYQGILMTTAAVLDVSGTTVVGEGRCAGLVLSGPRSGRGPALAIRYSKVEGVLALADPTAPAGRSGRATIAGDLDVSWSAIDQLILDGRSLGAGESAPSGPPNRLVATNATIRKLELFDPLPGEVDLADAKVVVWDFGPTEGSMLLARFRNVLENQRPFKRNVYQEVEAYLYNAGFEDLAKRIHTDLVTRHHRDTIGLLRRRPPSAARRWALAMAWLKRAGSGLNYFMTGNFTSEWRPIFVCWLPVWLISSCYFADPARIAVAPGDRASFAGDPTPICATLDHWSAAESLKFTTRYVLPVIPSVGMEQLEAADGLEAHPRCLSTSDRIAHERPTVASRIRHAFDWLRPSTAATWARLLSWLFLSLATGTIFAKMSRTPRSRGG